MKAGESIVIKLMKRGKQDKQRPLNSESAEEEKGNPCKFKVLDLKGDTE